MYMNGFGSYIFVILGMIISLIASTNVNVTFSKYSKVWCNKNIKAYEVATQILHSAGIYDVRIEHIKGNLTDHYSPKEKVLRLSDSVYNSSSVAAIGVAAHECGHAIQHDVGYKPLGLRSLSVPVVNIGSKLSWPILFIGIILGFYHLQCVGLILFLLVVFFQLITLPVEFNASHRALKILKQSYILDDGELKGATKVLTAAALTYVAALVNAVLQFIRMLGIMRSSSR